VPGNAVVLLVGAGLLGRSFLRLASVDPRNDASRILEVSLSRSAGRRRTSVRRPASALGDV
jgi:hypothetical protein